MLEAKAALDPSTTSTAIAAYDASLHNHEAFSPLLPGPKPRRNAAAGSKDKVTPPDPAEGAVEQSTASVEPDPKKLRTEAPPARPTKYNKLLHVISELCKDFREIVSALNGVTEASDTQDTAARLVEECTEHEKSLTAAIDAGDNDNIVKARLRIGC